MNIDLTRLQYLQRTDLFGDDGHRSGALHIMDPATGEGLCQHSQKETMTPHARENTEVVGAGNTPAEDVCYVCLKALRARSDVDRFYRRQVDYSTGAETSITFDTRLAGLTQQRKKAIRRAQDALKTASEVGANTSPTIASLKEFLL